MKGRVNYGALTPVAFLKRSAYVFPTKTAVVNDDRRYSYGEFAERAKRLANAITSVGLDKGDRVAFLSSNTPQLLEAHYGVPLAGGILVAINIRLSSREIAYIINHSEAKLVFVDSELSHLIEPIQQELPSRLIVNSTGGQSERLKGMDYEEFLRKGRGGVEWEVEDENDIVTINYTSGTTGTPKGVMYTHRGAYLNALGEALETGLDDNSVYLWTLPMFHCNGWCFTWAVTAVGGTHVCLRKISPSEVFRLIEEENVTHLSAAPTVLIALSGYARENNLKLSRKVRMITAGAPPSPTVIGSMEAIGAEIIHVYGLTEVYGPHSVCEWQPEWNKLSLDDRARLKARQGVPYVTALEMKVVDGNMKEVPHDGISMGEVVMRGNNVMAGYFKQPKETEETFRGGWFHSGDIAVVHSDGYIEVKDRKKDVIISGGENISSVEVENVLYQHSDVLEVAVIAIPDAIWGEVPKAFIVPKPGQNPNAEKIILFCRKHIAHFKCPKVVEFLNELPKTGTGKIQKYTLREKEWKGYEKRVH